MINKNNISNVLEFVIGDTVKIIDKLDLVKKYLPEDELLSTISFGKIIKYFIDKTIIIDTPNEAFKVSLCLSISS